MTDPTPLPRLSARALFRYRVISEVLVAELRGCVRVQAVDRVIRHVHLGPDGGSLQVSRRSVYRWLARYLEEGIVGLEDRPRDSRETDGVLEPALVTFLIAEKMADPAASIPELLEFAVVAGLLSSRSDVDRTTVWRTLRRRGVPTHRKTHLRDQRRFEKAHRLQLVLCDGKHFRAGPSHLKRVALFFIDDASRYVPTVVVGTSESALLFLRGLYRFLQEIGRIDAMYLDHGSGFIADDTQQVLASLGIAHILGTKGYPPGHGKIERFNRTSLAHILRHLDHPDVDPDCTALELRIEHFLRQSYNLWPHEGLGGKTSPLQRFLADERPLRPYDDDTELRRHFFVAETRTVTNDHVVKIDGRNLEMPKGTARQQVEIRRDALEPGRFFYKHEDRWLRLQPVRLHANANERRGPTRIAPAQTQVATQGAALTQAEAALAPITQPDGGFAVPEDKENSS